jgi:hypothetical protein
MIDRICPGIGLQVSSITTPYINMSPPSAGMVRYNIDHLEAYDGSTWIRVSHDANIILDYDTEKLLAWARAKRDQEQRLEKLKDHPAIADLLKQQSDLEEKIKIVEILIRDNNGTN